MELKGSEPKVDGNSSWDLTILVQTSIKLDMGHSIT